jgi:hypothetical protein
MKSLDVHQCDQVRMALIRINFPNRPSPIRWFEGFEPPRLKAIKATRRAPVMDEDRVVADVVRLVSGADSRGLTLREVAKLSRPWRRLRKAQQERVVHAAIDSGRVKWSLTPSPRGRPRKALVA